MLYFMSSIKGVKIQQNYLCGQKAAGGGISHFKTGNSSLENKLSEDHVRGLKSEYVEAAVTANIATMAREFSKKFNISHMTVQHELNNIGKVSVFGKRVTHDLSPKNP